MDTDITYGAATAADISGIKATARASWYATYKDIFEGDFIADFLTNNYSTKNLLRSVQNESQGFPVAKADDTVVGFCHYGSAFGDREGTMLYRMYIQPDYWRQGIGRRLMEMMEGRLKAQGVQAYFCYVHKDNVVGKGFYIKNGFDHDAAWDREGEWCMVKLLVET